MTTYNYLQPFEKILSTLLLNDFRLSDVQYMDLYRDYCKLMRRGNKKTFVVAKLADDYGVSVRKVYDLLNMFESTLHAPCGQFAPANSTGNGQLP